MKRAIARAKEIKELPPLYYVPNRVLCKCGHQVCIESIDFEGFYMRFYCMNQDCDQYFVNKKMNLPVITEYEIEELLQ